LYRSRSSIWLRLEPQDEVFLKIMSADRFNIVNLPKMSITKDHSAAPYDRYLQDDRIGKGLPPDPPTES
jgi:hypothetical protein